MGFLDTPLRVDVGDGEWIDIKRISASQFREMQKEAAKAKPAFASDTQDGAESFEILRFVRERIVAWSDPAPVTPENIERLPIDINGKLVQGLSAGSAPEVPLKITSPSSESSEETAKE